MTMGLTAVHILLCLLTAPALATKDLELSVNSEITRCGKVTLNCNVSSRNGLSIKLMKWHLNHTLLCSVDSEGNVTSHRRNLSDFQCEYKHGQFSLRFQEVNLLESGNSSVYKCNLHSNLGLASESTTVEFQECVSSNAKQQILDIPNNRNGAGSHGPMTIFLCILILLSVTLK